MNKKRKMMIGAVIVAVGILIGSVFAWQHLKKSSDEESGCMPDLSICWYEENPTNDSRTLIVWDVSYCGGVHPDFINIENLKYALCKNNHTLHNPIQEGLLVIGNLTEIRNNTLSNITYYDNDGNWNLSQNDTFVFRGHILDMIEPGPYSEIDFRIIFYWDSRYVRSPATVQCHIYSILFLEGSGLMKRIT